MANIGVIVFPGSNCDHDAYHAVTHVYNKSCSFIWHKETKLNNFGLVIIPGGFSYGDYLRSGAIARFSPIMEAVINYAQKGGLVLGICNGFQILLECGLLPGAMLHNNHLKFNCKQIFLKTISNLTPFTNALSVNEIIKIPVAHGEGNYQTDGNRLQSLYDNDQIVFKYCDEDGHTRDSANINGSLDNIAGIVNKSRNVLGMMPHPERAVESLLGSDDGTSIFDSVFNHLNLA